MGEVTVRPLVSGDVAAAQEVSYQAMRRAGEVYGWQLPELDDRGRLHGQRRISHCLEHDPAGCFVADLDGAAVGISLATRRGPLWFLSLLTVRSDLQAQGIGRRLLAASLLTFDTAGVICASDDPKALRRYHGAGFRLVPTFEAEGALDRSRLPSINGVTQKALEDGRDFVEDIAQLQRGAPHGPDLDFLVDTGGTLYCTDQLDGRGYLINRESGPVLVGATTEAAAARLLWTGLAEASGDKLEVRWFTHRQAWAVDVVLAAGLPMQPRGTLCLRGEVGPMWPYIPSGGLG